jgi:SAM-dependent methyltransferase
LDPKPISSQSYARDVPGNAADAQGCAPPSPGDLVADPDRPAGWTVLAGGFPQSHVDLDDPRHLEFDYVRRLGHIVDLAAPGGEPIRVLHLGGGGLTLARYVAATRPGSAQLAVDNDAGLVELVRQRLPLNERGRRVGIRVRVGDARAVLDTVRPGSFDLVIADLFTGGQTPAHLTSAEFTVAAAGALTEAGIFAVNIGDGPPLGHARARVATTRGIFPRACLIADPGVLRGRRFGNLVLAASRDVLPVAELARRCAADPFPGRVVHGADLDRFAGGAKTITDASATRSPAPPPDLFRNRRGGKTGSRRRRAT